MVEKKEKSPDEGLSDLTLECFLEGRTLISEMNDVFEGLTELGKRQQGPITFDFMEKNSEVFGSFSSQIVEAIQNYRNYFYRGGNQQEGEMSYAEQAVSHVYQGTRPGAQEFEQMKQAWDEAERVEIFYIVFRAFDRKFYKNYQSKSGIYMEFGKVREEKFKLPVETALQGRQVVVKEIETRLVEAEEGDWYAIDDVTFEL